MSLLKRFRSIKHFVFDLDGVLTDGSLYVFADGEQVRRMNIRDGFALQLAIRKGYGVAVISGGTSEGADKRLRKLGITDIFMGILNKKEFLASYLEENKIERQDVLFMGDDIPDHGVMGIVGLSCCPADAASEIKQASAYISAIKGGKGCAREVIEKVLKINGDWELETDVPSR